MNSSTLSVLLPRLLTGATVLTALMFVSGCGDEDQAYDPVGSTCTSNMDCGSLLCDAGKCAPCTSTSCASMVYVDLGICHPTTGECTKALPKGSDCSHFDSRIDKDTLCAAGLECGPNELCGGCSTDADCGTGTECGPLEVCVETCPQVAPTFSWINGELQMIATEPGLFAWLPSDSSGQLRTVTLSDQGPKTFNLGSWQGRSDMVVRRRASDGRGCEVRYRVPMTPAVRSELGVPDTNPYFR